FEKLVELNQPERSLSYSPIFQVMFLLQEDNLSTFNLNDLELSYFDIETNIVKFDLTFSVTQTSSGLEVSLVYNTSLFEDETIIRMLENYQVLLESLIDNPSQRISTLPILSDKEQSMLLKEFNQTDVSYPKGVFIHQLFEKQVALTPNSIAVSFEDKSLTYQELNERANQLANYLKPQIERQAIVGIYMQSCLEIVVAMMASLKAGIAYIPLSLYYPIDRLDFIINDLNLQLLITHSELKEQVSKLKVAKLYLDKEDSIFNTSAKNNPQINISGQEIAYIIHTSGSTGLPKGVVITQEAIVNHMVWMKDRFSITVEDAILQRTPISFDASVWEFYLPLIVGARLVLAKPDLHADIKYLLETISSYNITTIQFVPSLLSLIIEEKKFTDNKLKRVFCGGEALSPQLRELFFKHSKAEFYNLYGPTETTIDATYYQCISEAKNQPVLIGKPIDNLQIYILDKHLNPVPIGVIGELCIGGVALARGYYNRPDFTAERFIPNPFSNKPGERLYSTGDLARY
ncbi:MAG: non-ribosomal peptide synthase/amino acid adenylation enzyme, partial [bacterium]